MQDINDIYRKTLDYEAKMDEMTKDFIQQLRAQLWGAAVAPTISNALAETPAFSPKQTNKRAKRLTALQEDDSESKKNEKRASAERKKRASAESRAESQAALLAAASTVIDEPMSELGCERVVERKNSSDSMAPATVESEVVSAAKEAEQPAVEHSFARPQRAAKLKSEKNLKEPKLNAKMRRPSNESIVSVKLEREQRNSQLGSTKSSEDSILVLPEKAASIVELDDEEPTEQQSEQPTKQKKNAKAAKHTTDPIECVRELRICIKRERLTVGEIAALSASQAGQHDFAVPQPLVENIKEEPNKNESQISVLSSNSSGSKKTRGKKKMAHKPIKLERLSEVPAPVETAEEQTDAATNEKPRAASIYEDAMDKLPTEKPSAANDETVTLATNGNSEKPDATIVLGAAPNDATFCTNAAAQNTFIVPAAIVQPTNANATITLAKKSAEAGDATFNVPAAGSSSKDERASLSTTQQSMVTAKDNSHHSDNEDYITEDEDYLPAPANKKTTKAKIAAASNAATSSAKAYKMPTRTNELFNPFMQSPVKMRVEAFESVAAGAVEFFKSGRPKRTKENVPSSNTPGTIGKLAAPTLGRFLTPTQQANITPSMLAHVKKAPNSASKVMPFPKTNAGALKGCQSTSASRALSRENSAEEIRKGLQQLADDRKKQREQKHILAAQQREAKERERAERMAKLAKEREEKRTKKLQEAEQKKRELEEIQRKLRQQEEAAAAEVTRQKLAKKKAAEQERDMLKLIKPVTGSATKGKMLPPPPKSQSKYTFEMLHEDDSTDDEGKVTYKRPPAPKWSRSDLRGPTIVKQHYWPTEYIDSFFSVQPMTPDLKLIFPNIDARYLKRNSSVLWSTPPRYSELPKY